MPLHAPRSDSSDADFYSMAVMDEPGQATCGCLFALVTERVNSRRDLTSDRRFPDTGHLAAFDA